MTLSIVLKSISTVLLVAGLLSTVASVGEPRNPTDGKTAAFAVVLVALFVGAIWM